MPKILTKCDNCVSPKTDCKDCCDNPIYASVPRTSKFQSYIPTCPRGYKDCVNDPAYMKYSDPNWYKEIYGDQTPEEAMKSGSCWKSFTEDPDEEYYCYDDEDK